MFKYESFCLSASQTRKKNILNRSVQVLNNKMAVHFIKYIVVKCFPNSVELGWVGAGIRTILGLGGTNTVRIFCMSPWFFLLWLQEPIAVILKAPADGKLIVWHSCKVWWKALVQWGAAVSCYLPASLWRLFLTGHVSHQNISDGSSSFVFIPQQAAHSTSSVCNTLMSRQRVWLWPLKISSSRRWKDAGLCGTAREKHYVSPFSGFFAPSTFLSLCPWCFSHVVTKRSQVIWLISGKALFVTVFSS